MKLVAAFILGALSMWVLFALFEQDAPSPIPTTGSYGAPQHAAAAATPTQQSPQTAAPNAAPARDSDNDWPDRDEPANDAPVAQAAMVSDAVDNSRQPLDAPPPAQPADEQMPSVERLNDIPPLSTPIPVPMSPEHADVASRTEAIAELHRALESEPEDVAWAYEMQTAIQQFLLQSEPMQHFGSASVHCRTALCEIQAIGYAPGPAGQTLWSTVMGQMRLQPWMRQFAKTHGYASGQGDQFVIFTFLERNPATLQPPS